jgi:hypothetical protein
MQDPAARVHRIVEAFMEHRIMQGDGSFQHAPGQVTILIMVTLAMLIFAWGYI